jgi:glycosyltransferase involved in cell wall biosynthesis
MSDSLAAIDLEVVIPTANRPEKLGRCLAALAAARAERPFPVLVCDSSDAQRRDAVLAVCAEHDFVTLRLHSGRNVAAARNACARFAGAEVLVNVDDDIQVDPDAIVKLARHYAACPRPAAVAGSVAWDGNYSRPVVMRYIGYGRSAHKGEAPSFLVGAFFAYPRALALALPWNERIRTSDDRLMGALWRSHGVHLGYEPAARATHDPEHVSYDVDEQASHIYANLFDAVFANPELKRALSYELLGFLAGARAHCRSAAGTRRYLAAWWRGNRALVRDRRYLRRLVATELPATLFETPGR